MVYFTFKSARAIFKISSSYVFLCNGPWCEMNAYIIVDVFGIHFVYPIVFKCRRKVPEFYMGPQNFDYDQIFKILLMTHKGLFRNGSWSLLSKLISKSIDINTFYDQKGTVRCIYSYMRKVGHMFYLWSKLCTPCAPWGPKAPKGDWYRDEALEKSQYSTVYTWYTPSSARASSSALQLGPGW